MASNQGVKFYFGASFAEKSAGNIYFEHGTHKIYVGSTLIVENFNPADYATTTAMTQAIALAKSQVVNSLTAGNGIAIDATTSTQPEVSVKLSSKEGNVLSFATGSGEDKGLYLNLPAATDYSVYLESSTEVEGVLKRYTLKQGETGSAGIRTIGSIDIPKDLVVTSGQIVEVSGVKYLRLTIANQAEPVDIAVTDLCDVYTAGNGLTLSAGNEFAAVVTGAGLTVGSNGIALVEATTQAAGAMSSADKDKLNGIETGAQVNVQSDWAATEGDAFIANKPTALSDFDNDITGMVIDSAYVHTDNNFTTAASNKLADIATGAEVNLVNDVQVNGTSVVSNKVANVTVTEGTDNGTILVNGATVAVHGLQSAAYATAGAFETAGAAAAVKTTVDAYTVNGKAISTNPVLYGSDINMSSEAGASSLAAAIQHAQDTADSAVAAAGVTSFGGQSGAITVDTTGATQGGVKFAMNGKQLEGTVNGLGSAAWADTSAFDPTGAAASAATALKAELIGTAGDATGADTINGAKAYADAAAAAAVSGAAGNYATSTQGAKADTAIQTVSGTGAVLVTGGTEGDTGATISLVWESYSTE